MMKKMKFNIKIH